MDEKQEKTGSDTPEIKWYQGLIGLIAFIFILLMVAPILVLYYDNFGSRELSESPEQWGQFGDYIGGVLNPIFGFATFIALLYTIKLQTEELKATREELARSAKAQENSEQALAEQSKIFQIQQFESTFFSMLDLLNKLSTHVTNAIPFKLSFPDRQPCIDGDTDRFQSYKDSMYDELFGIYVFYGDKVNLHPDFLGELVRSKEYINEYFSEFKQFSLLLYQILKFIRSLSAEEAQECSETEKRYSNIARASIDLRILQILAVYIICQDMESYRPYQDLFERYAFLEHMPFKLAGKKEYRSNLLLCRVFYGDSAFGDSDYVKKLPEFG
ncbi:putative phage abortive infection protein [Neisseria dentiae]|uniref:putative phage abortive infection protein n=1 Tax=Neisseria dentiae TaxID=194197 RepID=UPI00211BF974|nr:putative phage abortive infection protein [Neisseria dentiae]MCQ9325659.1 putative phage abortive infection protein [Neisseria dentiae]